MLFLPMPHSLQCKPGSLRLTWRSAIVMTNTHPSALLYAQLLRDALREFSGLEAAIRRGKPQAGDIVLMEDAALPADTYRLSITEEQAIVCGSSDEALLHGVMTLRQHVQRHGSILPCLDIEDHPDLPNRGYYLDCSRGRIPTLEHLKNVADLLCRYKINQWQLYIEHTYLFQSLTEAWREDTPLTAEDILELDQYCRARHIELVPSLSSFGHMYKILSTKSYCDLCELRESEKAPFSYVGAMEHHTLNVSHPGAMDFVKSLIEEYMPLFTSRKFNICCDETFDLGRDRSAELAREKGAQALYLDHVTELCRWLLDKGITPMFWGDIILHHPETYTQIPEGVICLNWGYSPDEPEDGVRALAKMGATQYACPGVCTWNRWLPLLRDGFRNNRAMCRHAHQYGAIGLLNTDWGDYGHICQPWFSVPGILYGAALAWRAQEVSYEEMNQAISFLEYGDRSGAFMEAFDALCDHEGFDWSHALRWIEEKDSAKRHEIFRNARQPIHQQAQKDIEAIERGLTMLAAAVPAMDSTRRDVVQPLMVSAEGAKIWNEIGLYVAAHEEGMDVPCKEGAVLAAELERWYHDYRLLWRRVSREGSLHHTMKLIHAWADYLRGR